MKHLLRVNKFDLGRFIWVIVGQLYRQVKNSTLPFCLIWPKYHSLPPLQVVLVNLKVDIYLNDVKMHNSYSMPLILDLAGIGATPSRYFY